MDPAAVSKSHGSSMPEEYQHVYRSEISYVVHTLRRLGVAPAELEDVAHDVFMAVYRNFDNYDRERPLRPWIFSFIYRMARDHRELARHRYETSAPPHERASSTPSLDEHVDRVRLQTLLSRVLENLDFDKRSLIVMHDIDGMSVPNIAELLGVPLNTAYSRLRLARREFEKHLEKLGGRP